MAAWTKIKQFKTNMCWQHVNSKTNVIVNKFNSKHCTPTNQHSLTHSQKSQKLQSHTSNQTLPLSHRTWGQRPTKHCPWGCTKFVWRVSCLTKSVWSVSCTTTRLFRAVHIWRCAYFGKEESLHTTRPLHLYNSPPPQPLHPYNSPPRPHLEASIFRGVHIWRCPYLEV